MPRSHTGRELKTLAVASPLFASSENVTMRWSFFSFGVWDNLWSSSIVRRRSVWLDKSTFQDEAIHAFGGARHRLKGLWTNDQRRLRPFAKLPATPQFDHASAMFRALGDP